MMQMQNDEYTFNTNEIEAAIVDEDKITIPEWYGHLSLVDMNDPTRTGYVTEHKKIPPELIDEEEFSVMAYDMYRFLAWLFPRQYGIKQLE